MTWKEISKIFALVHSCQRSRFNRQRLASPTQSLFYLPLDLLHPVIESHCSRRKSLQPLSLMPTTSIPRIYSDQRFGICLADQCGRFRDLCPVHTSPARPTLKSAKSRPGALPPFPMRLAGSHVPALDGRRRMTSLAIPWSGDRRRAPPNHARFQESFRDWKFRESLPQDWGPVHAPID